jgi:hypothetical protein
MSGNHSITQERLRDVELLLKEGQGVLTPEARRQLECEREELSAANAAGAANDPSAVPPKSVRPLSDQERKDWEKHKATLGDHFLAPPPGAGKIYPPPQSTGALTEKVLDRLRQEQPLHNCFVAALALLLDVGLLEEQLRALPPLQQSDVDAITAARRAVAVIRNLWRSLIGIRLYWKLWQDELIALREMRVCTCPLGEYPSAVAAIVDLGERVLEKVWEAAAQREDPAFERGDESLPSFRCDWWYARLTALRRDYARQTHPWGLVEENNPWQAALLQEIAAWKRQIPIRQQSSAEPKTASGETQAVALEQLAVAVGDDNVGRIMAIANRQDWPAERKMEEILRIDSRYVGKDSQEWATLLGVSDAAIRKTAIWKQIRRAQAAE